MGAIGAVIYLVFCTAVAMVGFNIHHEPAWAIADFLFAPLALVKWLIFHEINLTLIIKTFSFLLK